jgi:hypothetical protein
MDDKEKSLFENFADTVKHTMWRPTLRRRH